MEEKNQGAKEKKKKQTNKKIKQKGLGKHPNPEKVKKTKRIPFGATHDPVGSPHMLATAPVAVPYPISPSKKRTRNILDFNFGVGGHLSTMPWPPNTSPLSTLSIAEGRAGALQVRNPGREQLGAKKA